MSSEASMQSQVNAKLSEFRVIWEKHRLTDKAIVLARVVSCSTIPFILSHDHLVQEPECIHY